MHLFKKELQFFSGAEFCHNLEDLVVASLIVCGGIALVFKLLAKDFCFFKILAGAHKTEVVALTVFDYFIFKEVSHVIHISMFIDIDKGIYICFDEKRENGGAIGLEGKLRQELCR